jgi:hypothetical protein
VDSRELEEKYMPQDPRKRQKAIMKKRSKQKASMHKSHQPGVSTVSPDIIRQARSFPLLECWITGTWETDKTGLIEVLVARRQPDDNICYGLYLLDNLCLGLKNTLARTNLSPARYQKDVESKFRGASPVKCAPELAHQMIYGSIDYAARYGFSPHKDFELTQYLLAPRGELAEPYQLTFGQDGKPLFVAGPYDDAKSIIKQLERTAGPGNFNYIAPLGGSPFGGGLF